MAYGKLLSPAALTDSITLRNRVVMAPMTTWAANDDLTVSDAEVAYYKARVQAVGLVLTGCSHVTPNGIGFTHEFAGTDDSFVDSLTKLAKAAKSGGAPAILQIFHAGNKALPELAPDGDVVGPSAVPVAQSGFAPAQTPRALSEPEILDLIAAFGATTRRAIEAGFDGVELHGAHGFLIQNFLSPATNHRNDKWGGSPENRRRFALEIIAEVKRAAASHATKGFIIGIRLSPEEAGGYVLSDTLGTIDALIAAGVTYIHASLGNVVNQRPHDAPDSTPIAKQIVEHVAGRLPVIAAGGLRTPAQAQAALDLGLSFVAVGQGLVMNPNWVELAAGNRAANITATLNPADTRTLEIPAKLWRVIEKTKGWFAVKEA